MSLSQSIEIKEFIARGTSMSEYERSGVSKALLIEVTL